MADVSNVVGIGLAGGRRAPARSLTLGSPRYPRSEPAGIRVRAGRTLPSGDDILDVA